MPKVTIKRDNATIEISDLDFEQVKELAGLNGQVSPRKRGPHVSKIISTLRLSEPDYKGFFNDLSERAKKFFLLLRQNPNGVSADHVAEKLGFTESTQIGGLTGAGIARLAPQYNVDAHNLYTKESIFENGERRTIYKPGRDIGLLL